MGAEQIRLARQLLGLNQTDFATLLGWTSKRNVVNLERGDKEVMTQTALAIECILRRQNKFRDFEMITEIKKRLDAQKVELKTKYQDLADDVQNIVFGENDVVESFLKENDICEDDVDLEYLRDLQHAMVQDLEI